MKPLNQTYYTSDLEECKLVIIRNDREIKPPLYMIKAALQTYKIALHSIADVYFPNFLLNPAKAIRPEPKRIKVAGAGTVGSEFERNQAPGRLV